MATMGAGMEKEPLRLNKEEQVKKTKQYSFPKGSRGLLQNEPETMELKDTKRRLKKQRKKSKRSSSKVSTKSKSKHRKS